MSDEVIMTHYFSEKDVPPFHLNILVVDNDATSLNSTVRMLNSLKYKAIGIRDSTLAWDKLRNQPGYFQLIVTEVHLPNLDGFKLKQLVDEEFAIPVIVVSVENNEEIIEKALKSGVMRYILKPATIADFKGIWQFAIAGMKGEKQINIESIGGTMIESSDGDMNQQELSCSSHTQKKRRVKQKRNEFTAPKKAKVTWTNQLQSQFLEAINIIGIENAVPKKILQLMNVEGLTRENVASHLQKYRLFLKQIGKMFVTVIKKANEDKDILLSKIASTHPSLVLKIIQEDLERTLKQTGRRNLSLECNTIYLSHLKYKLSMSLSDAISSQNYLSSNVNPYMNMGLSSGNINNLGNINVTRPYQPNSNLNGAYEVTSAPDLLQNVYNGSSQNPLISPSELLGHNFNTSILDQTSSSSFANSNAIASLLQERLGSSHTQPNGNGVPNAFDHMHGSGNERNINNVTSGELLKSSHGSLAEGVESTTNEASGTHQTLPISMEGIANNGNMMMGTLSQPQHHHQIYDQGNSQPSATVNNNFASQVTSNESYFDGIDVADFPREDILNTLVPMQDGNKGDDFGEDILPLDCTMHPKPFEFGQHEEELDTLNQWDDHFPSFDQLSTQEWDYNSIESIFNDML